MKSSTLLTLAAASHHAVLTLAYPGMDHTLADIYARDEVILTGRSTELLGDLLASAASTPVGTDIAGILRGSSPAAADNRLTYKAPGSLNSDACKKDRLCVWKYIADDLAAAFAGCSDRARAAIRLGFHDAAAWDRTSPYGGADGSIILSGAAGELSRRENTGLQDVAGFEKGLYDKYASHTANRPGMADIVQLAANVATVVCPGGPRIRSFAGRRDNATPGPTGRIPGPRQSAQELIDLFAAKTFTAADLVALLGAHSTSRQRTFDPSRAGASQDSTPDRWDTRYYTETRTNDNRTNVLVFPSDRNVANFGATRAQWDSFAAPGGQGRWVPAYAAAYFRMSMLGVTNMNQLTDITRVLPLPR
ncbi:heme peroxidase [Microdochium bolleyi]|uniref:Peroxidase n=1 Tax=Microdochium bolleyi TaxID=196109 RepID=A0A136IUB5_9PEZI|nr:heme peroxidase [Microdochium bolleyi]